MKSSNLDGDVDPYAEVKAAYDAGKPIEIYLPFSEIWKLWTGSAPKFDSPPENYRVFGSEKAAPVIKEETIPPNNLGKNAPGGWKHFSKEKCLVMATGYFYTENEEGSWYWLFKWESGL